MYLLIRFNELLGCSRVLFLIRLSTTLISGVGACLEQDGKKIIALSTLSQLGVMMFSLSLGLWEMAFFHLLRHAIFKSLLFMCIGLYIHGGQDQQDLRGIGFQLDSAPVVARYFIVSSLSLTGFPFLSGFYSKDSIVELFEYSHIGVLRYGLVLVSLLFTVFYRIRLITNLYLTETNTKLLVSTGGTGLRSILSILLLFILSVSGGSAMFRGFVPVVLIGFSHRVRVGLVIAVVGFLVGSTWLSLDSRVSAGQLGLVGISIVSMWFLLDFFTLILTQGLRGGLNLLRGFDQGWLELLGAQGIFAKLKKPVSLLILGIELGLSVYLSMGFVIVLILIILNV